jgi:hypoxanthine phosphoribosyltransferase
VPQRDQGRPAFRRILGEDEIRARVAELAAAISRDHPDDEPLVVVAIMKGAVVFLADLVRHLHMPLEIELLKARSYDGERRREVRILDDAAELDLHGRHVLLLDTVLDSGHTLSAVRNALLAAGPARLSTCVLLSKRRPRSVSIEPEYVGMEIPDVFVVGYGLDHNNRWRHLPYVAELTAPAEMAAPAEAPEEDAHAR